MRVYKTSETKSFFTYEWFDRSDKKQKTELPPYDALYTKLRNCNPQEIKNTDLVNLLKSALTTDEAVINLKLLKSPPTGIENYQYLQQICKQEQMGSFEDFSQCYNKKDVVPTLETKQKLVVADHDRDIDMLNLLCTLPNLTKICLDKPTDAKFYHFTEADKQLFQTLREDVVGGPSVVSTRKTVIDDLFFESLLTKANQLMPANYATTGCVSPYPQAVISNVARFRNQ